MKLFGGTYENRLFYDMSIRIQMFSAYFRKFSKIAYENLGSHSWMAANPTCGIVGSRGSRIAKDRLYKNRGEIV